MKFNNILSLFLLVLLFLPSGSYAQAKKEPEINWQNLDLKDDGVFGISTDKAYNKLLKGKKHQPVIVAVLDGGVDINHEALKPAIWTNQKEIPGNGKDDDGNGFIDDVHGWNFFSTMAKGDEEYDIRELSKQVQKHKSKFSATSEYQLSLKALDEKLLPARNRLKNVQTELIILEQMLKRMDKTDPTGDDFRNYVPLSQEELNLQRKMVNGLKTFSGWVAYKKKNLERAIDHYKMELAYYENQDYDLLTGGPTSYHGTHIAGIIAAARDSKATVKGVADDVKIMVVRTITGINPTGEFPDEIKLVLAAGSEGDESDKAIAMSIRYAVDMGAKVINMSFGKEKATLSTLRDEAIKYAVSKDVLIVHASGNHGQDLDKLGDKEVFPNRNASDGAAIASGWIEVGASGWENDSTLVPVFSNYGKASVDVYAPGVDITSTAPRSRYMNDTGTSMAAPVVAGLAALIRSYYPKLSALQVKEIIMKSVVKTDFLKDKCISGGVVNAYEALKQADDYNRN